MALKAEGGGAVFATEKIESRVAAARMAGADWSGNPGREDIVAEIQAREPLGLDLVFECCGEQSALDQGVALLKPGGTLVVDGIPLEPRVFFDSSKVRRREIRIQNVRRQNRCLERAVGLIHTGRIKVDFLATHAFGVDEAREAYDTVADRRDGVMNRNARPGRTDPGKRRDDTYKRSPDGSKIMFHVPSRGLYAVPITGGDWQEILVFPDPHEANKYQSMILSPNGQWIAYAAVAGGNTDIYVMPCGGGEPVRVTSNPAVDKRPIWSYDGKRLAFASYGTGNPQIWTVGISSEGKPEGVPAQVTRENQVLGGNWTLDGRIGFPTAFRIPSNSCSGKTFS